MDTTWSDVRGVHSGSGHSLVEFEHLKAIESHGHGGAEIGHYLARNCGPDLLSLLKHPEERCHGADVEGVRGDGHDVIQNAGQLSIQDWKRQAFAHSAQWSINQCGKCKLLHWLVDGWLMIVDTSDPLRAKWSLDIEQFLHSQRVSLLIAHHGDVVQAVEVGESLEYRKKG